LGGFASRRNFYRWYNFAVNTDLPSQEFKPELISRRGEAIAWVCVFLVALGIVILVLSGQPLSWLVVLLEATLLASAALISLGNWSDRKTSLHIDERGIEYQNGLRRVKLGWSEVNEARVTPSPWGNKVDVYGEKSHISFRTLAEVKVRGELKGRFGFTRGEEILRRIVMHSNLEIRDEPGVGYYYVRK
jgi:hypothetical protein